jgi:hypothetical protein
VVVVQLTDCQTGTRPYLPTILWQRGSARTTATSRLVDTTQTALVPCASDELRFPLSFKGKRYEGM